MASRHRFSTFSRRNGRAHKSIAQHLGIIGSVAALVFSGSCSGQRPTDALMGGAGGMMMTPEFATLREAADAAGKYIGTAVDAEALRNEEKYPEILAREFNSVTPENATKWGPLAPDAESYDWEDADAIVEFAEEHSQAIKGHAFVWDQQTPSWLSSSMTEEELRTALKDHIQTTLERYRGKIGAWDVVNEAVDMDTESGYTESIFYDKLGPGYIEDAFRWAHEADPDVLLYYNEVAIERAGPKSDFTYELMRDLLDRGVPIDGIGFQSHVSTHRYPPLSNLRANIRRFADLGLRVNISELDARTVLMPGNQQERWSAQRIAFQQVVGACIVEPGCEGVTLWGFTDRYSWIADETEPDDPLIFDRNYQKKPAYEGTMDGLKGLLPVTLESVIENGDFSMGSDNWDSVGGTLAIAEATETNGPAACVSERAEETDGLLQEGLLSSMKQGGPFSFSAQVRLKGAESETTNAHLFVETEEGSTEEHSLATVPATSSEWTELAGYFGLGFEGTPTGIELLISGPPADVELCVRDVQLNPLTTRSAH